MKLSSVKYLVGIIVVGSLGFGAVQAGAQPPCNVVKLQRWYLSGCFWPCGTQYCQQCHDGNLFAAVIVNVDECVSRVNIFSDSGTANASSVSIWHTSIPEYLEVFIGEGGFPYSGSPTLPAVGNMGYLSAQTQLLPVTRVAGHVGGDVTGIFAGKVYRLDIDGSLGLLQMDESPGPGFPEIHAGSTLADFGNGITCNLGTIRRVDVTGDALAPISAPGGGIEDVLAGNLRGTVSARDFIDNIDVAGAIATAGGGAVTIRTTGNDARIGFVRAASINANITAGPSNDRGIIEWIKTTSGNLGGSISAQSVEDPAPGVAVVDVAGSFGFPSSITLAAGGLKGQIIINAANGGGTWTGTFTVGGVAVSPLPYYNNSSASIGGRAVGLAPFQMHGQDSVPPANGTSGAFPGPAIIRHYGPVFWDAPQGEKPYRAYYVALLGGAWPQEPISWVEITPDFNYSLASNGRDVLVTPITLPTLDFDSGIGYRFVPMRDATPPSGTTKLKCANVTSNPVVGAYDYRFRVY